MAMSLSKSEVNSTIPESDQIKETRTGAETIPDSEKGPTIEEEHIEVRKIHGFKWAALCASIYLTIYLYGLDTTVAAVTEAVIVETFGDVSAFSWLGAGFALGSVAVILPVGHLFGNFDMKWLYMISMGLFEIGSILCGSAPTMNSLIAGRVIAGLGGAGIYLSALNFFSVLTAPQDRGKYISGIGLCFSLGCLTGPLVGGGFTESRVTWRMAYFINCPLGFVLSPVFFLYLPSISFGEGSVLSRLRKLDWFGFLISSTLWCIFTVALTIVGITWSWSDGRSITMLVVLGVLLVTFIVDQSLRRGMLPVYLFRSRLQILLYITTSAGTSALNTTLYYMPLYFVFIAGDSALLAAVRLLPFIAVFGVSNLLAGRFLFKIGYYFLYYLLGGILILIGGVCMYTVDSSSSNGSIYGYSVLIAAGSALTAQHGYAISSIDAARISDKAKVDAISMQNFAQLGAIVICLVVSGQIFQGLAFKNLSGLLSGFTGPEIQSAIAGTSSDLLRNLDDATRHQAIEAIVSAMGYVYTLVIVAGGLLILCSLVMKKERLG